MLMTVQTNMEYPILSIRLFMTLSRAELAECSQLLLSHNEIFPLIEFAVILDPKMRQIRGEAATMTGMKLLICM